MDTSKHLILKHGKDITSRNILQIYVYNTEFNNYDLLGRGSFGIKNNLENTVNFLLNIINNKNA